MILPFHSDPPPLDQTEDGVVRISGTRIPLERVLRAFSAGATPEQIVQDFDVLAIEDVYAVINYYLHHRDEVDAYLAKAEEEAVANRNASRQMSNTASVRARLLARKRHETNG
jgi:uncharacterized protein (DUF433 family)